MNARTPTHVGTLILTFDGKRINPLRYLFLGLKKPKAAGHRECHKVGGGRLVVSVRGVLKDRHSQRMIEGDHVWMPGLINIDQHMSINLLFDHQVGKLLKWKIIPVDFD